MNRKILVALFLCPVAIFGATRVLDLTGGTIEVGDSDTTTSEFHNTTFLTDQELLIEMRESIKDRQGREDAYRNFDVEGTWSDKLNEVQSTFIKNHVLKPLISKNICTINVEKSFSRCPSGYDAVVIIKDGKATNEGWMISRSGCDEDPVAMFKYDVVAKTVQAKVSDKVGFIPLDDYFKLYESANKNLKKSS